METLSHCSLPCVPEETCLYLLQNQESLLRIQKAEAADTLAVFSTGVSAREGLGALLQSRRALWVVQWEWLSLAFPHNQGFKDESDGALKEALNEVCNMTLTALLKEDEGEILSVQDELYSLGEFFSNQGNRKAAVLMFVLYKLCSHEIPEAADSLDGLYKEAFLKMAAMLEDSGWELKPEGEEEGEASDL